MNKPDKIYVPAEWMNVPSNLFETETSPDATEYIRKDAVTQAIREYLENWLDAYKVERLIDKIEEL